MVNKAKINLSLSTLVVGLALSSGSWAGTTTTPKLEWTGSVSLDPTTKEAVQFDFITNTTTETIGSFTGYLITGTVDGAGGTNGSVYTNDSGSKFSYTIDNADPASFNGSATDNLVNYTTDSNGNKFLELSGGGFSITAIDTSGPTPTTAQYQFFESGGQLQGCEPVCTTPITLGQVAISTPEPEEWAMLLLGMPLVGWVVRRKQAENQHADMIAA